jgi:cysteine-rich repeat protein
MRSPSLQAMLSTVFVQVVACGFPRPADIESDSNEVPSICGNSQIEPGEDCDDGNAIDDGNGCDGQCHKNAICGDSKIQKLFEICDGTSGCSMDCKEFSIQLYPSSDNYGRYNGTTQTWDGVFSESDPIGDVDWVSRPEEGGPIEFRTALEFETHSLHPMDLLKTAHLTAFATAVSQQAPTVRLNGYPGDGEVTIQDMDTGTSLSTTLIKGPGPVVFDVGAFIQQATNREYAFTGFLLRVDRTAPTDPTMGLAMALNDNSDQTIRPRLEITYCTDSDLDGVCD